MHNHRQIAVFARHRPEACFLGKILTTVTLEILQAAAHTIHLDKHLRLDSSTGFVFILGAASWTHRVDLVEEDRTGSIEARLQSSKHRNR